jgi:hypothetical protein
MLQTNDMGLDFGLGLNLEASHYGHRSPEAVGVYGQRFGLWTWHLEASH